MQFVKIERPKLLAYLKGLPDAYREGNQLFAFYASFPGVFTPHMLYQLWLNFNAYQKDGEAGRIHPIAVSDLIQSNICREIGFELYEMEEGVQQYFELNHQQLFKHIDLYFSYQDVAAFTYAYQEKFLNTTKYQNIKDVLYWKSISYVSPAYAAQQITSIFDAKKDQKDLSSQEVYLLLQILEQEKEVVATTPRTNAYNKHVLLSENAYPNSVSTRPITHPAILKKFNRLIAQRRLIQPADLLKEINDLIERTPSFSY